MGDHSVFLVDEESSPSKARARIERFFQMSDVNPSELPKPVDDGRFSLTGKGDSNIVNGIAKLPTTTVTFPECTHCGHPRSQSAHIKVAWKHCGTYSSQNCMRKPSDFLRLQ